LVVGKRRNRAETPPFLWHGESSVAGAGAWPGMREKARGEALARRSLQFYANLRLIRFEYGQKPSPSANRALKPSC
jgi:hypothetical protein